MTMPAKGPHLRIAAGLASPAPLCRHHVKEEACEAGRSPRAVATVHDGPPACTEAVPDGATPSCLRPPLVMAAPTRHHA